MPLQIWKELSEDASLELRTEDEKGEDSENAASDRATAKTKAQRREEMWHVQGRQRSQCWLEPVSKEKREEKRLEEQPVARSSGLWQVKVRSLSFISEHNCKPLTGLKR